MTWELEYSDELQVVQLTIAGDVSGQELQDAAAARIALGREKGVTNFIINAEDLRAPRSTTVSVLEIPTKVYPEHGFDRKCSIAVVAPTDAESQWITHFFEDICFNRGWRVQTFPDLNGALSWLQKATP